MIMIKFLEQFDNFKTVQKVECVLAAIFTLASMVCIPVYAWFAFNNSMETMTKVKEPDDLDIRAGNFDQIINFDLRNVSIESLQEEGTAAYYVFSVSAGDYKIPYNIQLAHTTNIPFKYSLYHATRHETNGAGFVEYHPRSNADEKTYYEIGDPITLEELNADDNNEEHYGRKIAKKSDIYYSKTYSSNDTTSSTPEIYAIPLYLRTQNAITPSNKGANEHDYFILKLEWDSPNSSTQFDTWNKAEDNKETDIIYITAVRSTS